MNKPSSLECYNVTDKTCHLSHDDNDTHPKFCVGITNFPFNRSSIRQTTDKESCDNAFFANNASEAIHIVSLSNRILSPAGSLFLCVKSMC